MKLASSSHFTLLTNLWSVAWFYLGNLRMVLTDRVAPKTGQQFVCTFNASTSTTTPSHLLSRRWVLTISPWPRVCNPSSIITKRLIDSGPPGVHAYKISLWRAYSNDRIRLLIPEHTGLVYDEKPNKLPYGSPWRRLGLLIRRKPCKWQITVDAPFSPLVFLRNVRCVISWHISRFVKKIAFIPI